MSQDDTKIIKIFNIALAANGLLQSTIFSTIMENRTRSPVRRSSSSHNSSDSLSFMMNNIFGANRSQRTIDLFNNIILASVGLFSGLHCLNEIVNIVKNPPNRKSQTFETSQQSEPLPRLSELANDAIADADRTGRSIVQKSNNSNRLPKRRLAYVNPTASSTEDDVDSDIDSRVDSGRFSRSERVETTRNDELKQKIKVKLFQHRKNKPSPYTKLMNKRSNGKNSAVSNVRDNS